MSLRFIADLGRRAGVGVPVPLLDCASWAASRFAPFVRMAVSHAVRRGLAEAVLRRWVRVRDPADLADALGLLPPAIIARPASSGLLAPVPLPLAVVPPPAPLGAPVDALAAALFAPP